jgi:hypothetical protein
MSRSSRSASVLRLLSVAWRALSRLTTEYHMTAQQRFSKPKVFLIDTPGPWTQALRAKGFTVAEGSFGVPCLSIPRISRISRSKKS